MEQKYTSNLEHSIVSAKRKPFDNTSNQRLIKLELEIFICKTEDQRTFKW